MKNCLIIDDDPLICDLIKHFCSKQDWIGSTLSVGDGSQALQALNAQTFDLIFLDYNLPDSKGKNILDLMPSKIPTVMVTTEEAFGAESYEYEEIIDFLLKPISYERFLKALLRFQQFDALTQAPKKLVNQANTPKTLIVKEGNTTVIIRIDEIRYIKSESNYVLFYLENKRVMCLESLRKLETELPSNFVRTQKSFIINLDYLETIDAYSVKVENTQVPIGASYKEELHAKVARWSEER